MSKLARLKTIFRNNRLIEAVSDSLDDNSVDTVNIVNQSVTPPKVKDNSLGFDKMTNDTKFITTNNAICALRDVGGISIGESIDSVSIRDLLKEIIIPYTKPAIGDITYVENSIEGVINDRAVTGESIFINTVTVPVMIKSENIMKIQLDLILNDVIIDSFTITGDPVNGISGFQPNNFKNFTFTTTTTIKGQNVTDTIKLLVSVTDAKNGVTTRYRSIVLVPKLYYGNSNASFEYESEPTLKGNVRSILSDSEEQSPLYTNYNTNTQIVLQYAKPVNQYSYILIPVCRDITIPTAIDQNGFTQNITYVGDTNIPYNGVSIHYRLFKTGVSTMTDTFPIYKFNLKVNS